MRTWMTIEARGREEDGGVWPERAVPRPSGRMVGGAPHPLSWGPLSTSVDASTA